ncbi:MAG: TraB/GumN family protein [Clostridia bacterium]
MKKFEIKKARANRSTCKWLLTMAALFALSLPLAACDAGVSQAPSTGICYRVTNGRNELFLLGSIHIGSKRMYPFGSHIAQALNAADTLVFECDTEAPSAVPLMNAMMACPPGETLEQLVSPETYALLAQVCEQTGIPLVSMNALRPWAAVSALSLPQAAAEMGVKDANAAYALGVEEQVRKLGGDKPRAYLETVREQLDVLSGFSAELQDYLLSSTCTAILHPEEATGMDAGIQSWPDWWANGDADAFAQSYIEGAKADPQQALIAEYNAALITARNQRMADGLRALLDGEEGPSYFATIGLLHLVLPGDSVVERLQSMGYQVERVLPHS